MTIFFGGPPAPGHADDDLDPEFIVPFVLCLKLCVGKPSSKTQRAKTCKRTTQKSQFSDILFG
jgi:hypothetical protein